MRKEDLRTEDLRRELKERKLSLSNRAPLLEEVIEEHKNIENFSSINWIYESLEHCPEWFNEVITKVRKGQEKYMGAYVHMVKRIDDDYVQVWYYEKELRGTCIENNAFKYKLKDLDFNFSYYI